MGDTTDDLGVVIDDSPPLVTPEPDEAATPATPAEPQEKTASDEPDPQKTVAKYAFEARAAKREADALRKQLEEAKKAPQPERPAIPDVPNPLSVSAEEHARLQQQRENAIREAALYDARQKALNEQAERAEADAQRARLEALNKSTQTYASRAVQLGVKPEELQQAGQVVAQFGLDDAVAELILGDDHGPLITKYLASDADAMERLASLPPLQAAIEIVTTIKPKAASLKPRVSNAPPPQESLGMGAASFSSVGPPGATYE
jgi:hypothetical protein